MKIIFVSMIYFNTIFFAVTAINTALGERGVINPNVIWDSPFVEDSRHGRTRPPGGGRFSAGDGLGDGLGDGAGGWEGRPAADTSRRVWGPTEECGLTQGDESSDTSCPFSPLSGFSGINKTGLCEGKQFRRKNTSARILGPQNGIL